MSKRQRQSCILVKVEQLEAFCVEDYPSDLTGSLPLALGLGLVFVLHTPLFSFL